MKKRKIKWKWDYGCYEPFCPYCGEVAWLEDKCANCGEEYQWTEPKHKPTVVQVDEYTITQSTNNNISITKYDKLLFHAQCTKKKTEEELKEYIDIYHKLSESLIDKKSQK